MKKLMAFVLALALVLAIAGCGKKEEPTTAAPTEAPTTVAPFTTEAPTTPAPTTEAPTTEAPTTEAPTTEAPTTEAPTTEAPTTEAPVDMDAQEVLDTALANMETILRGIGKEEQAEQVTFSGKGSGGLTITIAMGEQKMDIPVKASVDAEGVMDTGKGGHLTANYDVDLGMLASMLGSEDGQERLKGAIEAYVDFASEKVYEKEDDVWYYSETGPVEIDVDEDEHLAGLIKLDEIFDHYDFGALGDQYVIEGPLKVQLPEDAEDMLPEDIAMYMDLLEGLEMNARITISRDRVLPTGIKLEIGELTIDLSSVMEGFVASLDGIKAEIALNWGEGTYELPKEVEESAVEKPVDPGLIDGDDYPWAASVFTLKDEALADAKEFSLKAESVEVNEYGEVIVKFDAENKLDKSLTFRFDDVTVNGFLTGTYCSEEVEAKTSGDFEMTIYPGALSLIGAESVDQISFLLKVYDTDDYFSDGYLNEAYTLYPTGTDPETYVAPERRTADTEVAVLDNDDVTVVIMEGKFETYFGYCVVTYVENKTDKDLSFEFEDVKLNGKEVENPYWTIDIPAGSRGFDSKYFYDSTLKELEIEKVETISATLNVEEDDFFSDEVLYTADVLFEAK